MIFLKSLFVFIPTLILLLIITYVYTIATWFIVNNFRFVFWYLRDYPRMSYEEKRATSGTYKKMLFDNPFLFKKGTSSTKFFKIATLLFLVANFILFFNMYNHYNAEDSPYAKSKPYLISASVANVYSVGVSEMSPPFVLHVYYGYAYIEKIKQFLFDSASEHMPKESAEKAFWEAKLFFYPYAKHHYRYLKYYYIKDFEVRRRYKHDEFGEKLNRLWELLETMQEKKMEDKSLEIDMISLMPLFLDYYISNELYVVPYDITLMPDIQTSLYLELSPQMERRHKLMRKWMDELKEIFLHDSRFTKIVDKTPQIVILNEWVALMNMHSFISAAINKRTFSCDTPLLFEYIDRRNNFIKVEGDIKEPFEKLYERKKLKFILNMKSELKDSFQGEFARRVLEEFCQVEVAGVSRNYQPNPKHEGYFGNVMDRTGVYAREIKILKEMFR